MPPELEAGASGSEQTPSAEVIAPQVEPEDTYLDSIFDPEGDEDPVDEFGNVVDPDDDPPADPDAVVDPPAGDDPPADPDPNADPPAEPYTYAPPIPRDAFSAEELAQLQDALDSPDPAIRLNANIWMNNRLVQHNMRAQEQTQAQLGGFNQEFTKKHGGAMQEYLNTVDPARRADPLAAKEAGLWAIRQFMDKTGASFEDALQAALTDLRGQEAVAVQKPAAVSRRNPDPIPAADKMTTPSAVGAGGGGTSTRQRRMDFDLKKLDGLPGFSNADLVAAAREDLTKTRR